MPTISTFYGIIIRMFFDEHAPPHFHAQYGEFKASIDIKSFDPRQITAPGLGIGSRLGGIASSRIARKLGVVSKTFGAYQDRAFAVGVESMYSDVVEAKITGPLEFKVRFADGLSGQVRLLPSHLYGVFEKLEDPDFFSQIQVTDGFVSWPGEIDLAPDAMYQAIRENGKWVLR